MSNRHARDWFIVMAKEIKGVVLGRGYLVRVPADGGTIVSTQSVITAYNSLNP